MLSPNSMLRSILVVALALALPVSLSAQSDEEEALPESQEQVNERLQKEIDELRGQFEAYKDGEESRRLARRRQIRVYGDLSLRWQHLNSTGLRADVNGESSKLSRPEYRARLGVTGFILDEFKHRLKYNIRLSNQGHDEYNSPLGAPATSYRPFEAFGSTTSIQLDRFWLRYEYKRFLYMGLGRWKTPLRTTDMLFDPDVGFTGYWAALDVGRVSDTYDRSDFDDWRDFGEVDTGVSRLFLTGAAYYLAQDNVGVPQTRGDDLPHGFSLQLASKMRFGVIDTAWTFAGGIHYFAGSDEVAPNVGTGTTFSTTNSVDSNGDVSSSFTLLDFLIEASIYEERTASLKATVHIVNNLGAEGGVTSSEKNDLGLMLGLQWGALQVEEAKEFQLRYRYVYVEANALLPEFNHEEVNTNYKGHRMSVVVALDRGLVATFGAAYGKRIDRGIMGVGRDPNGNPGSPSEDYELRIKLGMGLRF